jgi:hypothetical protein
MGEVYTDSQSQSFNLTAGEFDINDTDKKKSTGVLYPQCQLAMDKEGQLQFQLAQNPWNETIPAPVAAVRNSRGVAGVISAVKWPAA